jgi:hypothetical protein
MIGRGVQVREGRGQTRFLSNTFLSTPQVQKNLLSRLREGQSTFCGTFGAWIERYGEKRGLTPRVQEPMMMAAVTSRSSATRMLKVRHRAPLSMTSRPIPC